MRKSPPKVATVLTSVAPDEPQAPADPLLTPEIAAVVQRLLGDVVAGGTAQRLAGGLMLPDGHSL